MRRLTIMLVLMAASAATRADSEVSRVVLRPQAVVYGSQATLADVLVMRDVPVELAQRLAGETVGPATTGVAVVSHDEVVTRLSEAGVNLARVLVGGALKCEVTYRQPESPPASAEAALLRPVGQVGAKGETTLADLIRRHVNDELAELGGTAELQFDRAGEDILSLTSPPWEFRIHSSSGGERLGLREFRVVIRRDGRTQRTAQVFAQVRMTRQVVVARRPLSIGNYVRPDDVQVETRVFEQGDTLGLGAMEEAIGQQVKAFVARGEQVNQASLKPSELVRRSRPVTVLGAGDSVHVRLAGIALDSGGYGDTVRVRLGEGRNGRQQVRGVVTGVGTVRLQEDAQ